MSLKLLTLELRGVPDLAQKEVGTNTYEYKYVHAHMHTKNSRVNTLKLISTVFKHTQRCPYINTYACILVHTCLHSYICPKT